MGFENLNRLKTYVKQISKKITWISNVFEFFGTHSETCQLNFSGTLRTTPPEDIPGTVWGRFPARIAWERFPQQ